MFCPECGAQNADGSKFCMKCGQSLPKAGAPGTGGSKPLVRILLIAIVVLLLAALAVAAAFVVLPAVMPSDNWLAYQTRDAESGVTQWVLRAGDDRPTAVVNGASSVDYTWRESDARQYFLSPFSPAGNRLVVEACGQDGCSLLSLALGADSPQALVTGTEGVSYLFSPTSGRICYEYEQNDEGILAVADLDGKNHSILAEHTDGAWCIPAIDSKHNLSMLETDQARTLVLSDADGTNQNVLVNHAGNLLLNWSGDNGRTIAYANKRGGKWDVSVVESDGEEPVQLAGRLEEVDVLNLSPDGKSLLLGSSQDGRYFDLHLIDIKNAQSTTLANNMSEVYGQFLPGGEQLLISVVQSGTAHLYLADAEGENKAAMAQPAEVDDSWSAAMPVTMTPDGQKLVFYWAAEGYKYDDKYDVLVTDITTGEQVALLRDSEPVGNIFILDNDRAVFGSNEDGGQNLYVAPLDGGEKLVLSGPVDDVYEYEVSADGKWIAYSERNLGVEATYLVKPDGSGKQKIAEDTSSLAWSE